MSYCMCWILLGARILLKATYFLDSGIVRLSQDAAISNSISSSSISSMPRGVRWGRIHQLELRLSCLCLEKALDRRRIVNSRSEQ